MRPPAAILPALLLLLGRPEPAAESRVAVVFDTAEPEAALAILDKRRAGGAVDAADWERLFATEGYRRLTARETAMKRPFTRADFRAFLESDAFAARAAELSATLARWKTVNVAAAAERALAYLPADARIRATIFPVVKPKPNSFVFNEPDAGIFLALDPAIAPEKLANTLAHELHHIGFAASCGAREEADDARPGAEARAAAAKWLSAFGEGFAMLAAAGGPDVHPHAASPPDERARWDRDAARADADLATLDRFFADVLAGRLVGGQVDARGFSFFGVQGPWYTVGYRMATTIEKASGREAVIAAFCDPRRLPAAYNRAADRLKRRGARWGPAVVARLVP